MVRLDVPYIDQSVRYPTGCESVSTVMLLQYLGCEINVDYFIDKVLAKREFQIKEGQIYGPDPREYFCGSPYDEEAYGCYAPVICKALNTVFAKENLGYAAVDETGTSMQDLLRKYIDRGMPVIFWACIDMKEPITGPEWKLLDSGQPFIWISNEHCMLLVGYDENGYYFNDPYENHGVIRYDKELVEERHRAQYEMAVGVVKDITR